MKVKLKDVEGTKVVLEIIVRPGLDKQTNHPNFIMAKEKLDGAIDAIWQFVSVLDSEHSDQVNEGQRGLARNLVGLLRDMGRASTAMDAALVRHDITVETKGSPLTVTDYRVFCS